MLNKLDDSIVGKYCALSLEFINLLLLVGGGATGRALDLRWSWVQVLLGAKAA